MKNSFLLLGSLAPFAIVPNVISCSAANNSSQQIDYEKTATTLVNDLFTFVKQNIDTDANRFSLSGTGSDSSLSFFNNNSIYKYRFTIKISEFDSITIIWRTMYNWRYDNDQSKFVEYRWVYEDEGWTSLIEKLKSIRLDKEYPLTIECLKDDVAKRLYEEGKINSLYLIHELENSNNVVNANPNPFTNPYKIKIKKETT